MKKGVKPKKNKNHIKKHALKKKNFWIIDKSYFILLRYLLLLVFMFSLPLIYLVLTPVTKYSSSFLLDILFKEIQVEGDYIIINFRTVIEIIPACVAGSAYLLLLIINLSVQMNIKKRLYSLLISFLSLLALNILRIILLSIFYYYDLSFFDFAHKLFWYLLSTIFVLSIWFFNVWLFSIKEIPIYADIVYFINNIKKKK